MGPFAAGVVLAAVPVVILLAFLSASSSRASPPAPSRAKSLAIARAWSRRGSPSRTTTAPTRTSSSGRTGPAARRSSACACRAARVDEVGLRYVRDGEPRGVAATLDEETETETWWRASLPALWTRDAYRWVLSGGDFGYAWLNGLGIAPHEVADADDFVFSLDRGGPDWHLESVVYEIYPDRFATTGLDVEAPEWAVRRAWDELRPAAAHDRG